jgi:hypothetical protein
MKIDEIMFLLYVICTTMLLRFMFSEYGVRFGAQLYTACLIFPLTALTCTLAVISTMAS